MRSGTPLAETRGAYNAVSIVGDAVGRMFFHGLGAVQLSAPNSAGNYHCDDEYEVMCYLDSSGTPMRSGLPLPRFVSLKSDRVNLRKGPSTDYPTQWVYRRAGLPLEIIEVQSGSYLGEDDIVRFEDRYGRSDASAIRMRNSRSRNRATISAAVFLRGNSPKYSSMYWISRAPCSRSYCVM